MSKQTAVEFLIKAFQDTYGDKVIDLVSVQIEQAKQMFNEQIIDAHIEGQRVFDKHPHTQWTNDQAEFYYKQTFKSEL